MHGLPGSAPYLDRTETKCFGKSVKCCSLNNPTGESFAIDRRSIMNVIDWGRDHVRTRPEQDLAPLEKGT
jgi:hypothetical protein